MTVGFFIPQSLQYCSPVTDRYLAICDALKVGGEEPEERLANLVAKVRALLTELGAAQLIGEQAAVALAPNEPEQLRVSVPPEPRGIRSDVESDVNTLFLVLGGVSLLVGAIGIANVTLVSVLERVGEIGLRRAVGAARRHIASQFLVESAPRCW